MTAARERCAPEAAREIDAEGEQTAGAMAYWPGGIGAVISGGSIGGTP